jgi:predicted enzyme related to lactoylglutathione lyase
VQIQYLEIVTPDVDATCATLGQVHGVDFSDPVEALGNARTAPLPGGGMLGVRGPMAESENPIVRFYMLVDDIEAATRAAEASGGEIAHPPLEIPGVGTFSIYIQGGVHYGLWQR